MAVGDTVWKINALANLEHARKSHGRLLNKKSKSGCFPCRTRRVKCDESKPECSRCVVARRPCEYDKPQKSSTIALSKPVGTIAALGLNTNDLQIFSYFINFTAPRVAGNTLDRAFWTEQLLQVCHHEPFALNAVLAIATLHRNPQYLKRFAIDPDEERNLNKSERLRRRKPGDPWGNQNLSDDHILAIRYYHRAITFVRAKLNTGTISNSLAILSCVLFLTIEIFRDDLFAAVTLGRQCSQLTMQADATDPLAMVLKSALTQLSVMASTFGYTIANGLASDVLQATPDRYDSIGDARTALFKIMAQSQRYATAATDGALYRTGPMDREASADEAIRNSGFPDISATPPTDTGVVALDRLFPEVHNGSDEPDGDMSVYGHVASGPTVTRHETSTGTEMTSPAALDWEGQCHMAQLERWHKVFSRTIRALPEVDSSAVSGLMMNYHVSVTWLSTRRSQSARVFDACTEHYRQILHHARIYNDARKVEGSHLTFETGAIPCLYYVATSCRVPSIRRKAVQLLRTGPSKQGIWGAGSTAQLATTLIWLEERELDLPMPYEPLPDPLPAAFDDFLPREEHRVHHHRILKDNQRLKFYVKATRYYVDASGQRQQRTTTVPIGSDRFRPEEMVACGGEASDQDIELMEGPPARYGVLF